VRRLDLNVFLQNRLCTCTQAGGALAGKTFPHQQTAVQVYDV